MKPRRSRRPTAPRGARNQLRGQRRRGGPGGTTPRVELHGIDDAAEELLRSRRLGCSR